MRLTVVLICFCTLLHSQNKEGRVFIPHESILINPRNGLHVEWHPGGIKKSETEYIQGYMIGKYREWYIDGRPKSVGSYDTMMVLSPFKFGPEYLKMSVKVGLWRTYSQHSNTVTKTRYKKSDYRFKGPHEQFHNNIRSRPEKHINLYQIQLYLDMLITENEIHNDPFLQDLITNHGFEVIKTPNVYTLKKELLEKREARRMMAKLRKMDRSDDSIKLTKLPPPSKLLPKNKHNSPSIEIPYKTERKSWRQHHQQLIYRRKKMNAVVSALHINMQL